jgi:competence protein ComEA
MKSITDLLSSLRPANPLQQKLYLAFGAMSVVLLVAVMNLMAPKDSEAQVDFSTEAIAGEISGEIEEPLVNDAKIFVHVIGEIKRPGIYQLEPNSRIFDLIFQAGGFTEGANTASINLARELRDGEQLRVLNVSEALSTIEVESSTININSADAADLDRLPGIGPTLAQRIIDFRTANGAFTSINQLRKVSGIGQKLFDQLKTQVGL